MINASRVWSYCYKAFAKVGIKLQFHTDDIRKTYKWRYVEAFTDKLNNLKVKDTMIEMLINNMVGHAHKTGKLKRGFAIFTSDKMFEAGLNGVEREVSAADALIDRITADAKILATQPNAPQWLLERENPRALPNIVKYHIQGKLSAPFLALSKTCKQAMSKLSGFERSLLPNGGQILILCDECTRNITFKLKLHAIMGNDWSCL